MNEYAVFWLKFGLAMPLAAVALMMFITILGIPIGLLIMAFIGRWLGKSWKEMDDKKQAARRRDSTKLLLDVTIDVPEEELPWLI